jgi:hypothetical protein
MTEPQTIKLIRTKPMGGTEEIEVQAKPTTKGNLSFTHIGIRHILKPDGAILWCVKYANQKVPSWDPSPTLRLAAPVA